MSGWKQQAFLSWLGGTRGARDRNTCCIRLLLVFLCRQQRALFPR